MRCARIGFVDGSDVTQAPRSVRNYATPGVGWRVANHAADRTAVAGGGGVLTALFLQKTETKLAFIISRWTLFGFCKVQSVFFTVETRVWFQDSPYGFRCIGAYVSFRIQMHSFWWLLNGAVRDRSSSGTCLTPSQPQIGTKLIYVFARNTFLR